MAEPSPSSAHAADLRGIPVTDALERPRRISLYRRGDRVVLLLPPGEGALMCADDARRLADCLREQADAIDSRGPGRVLSFRRREVQPS